MKMLETVGAVHTHTHTHTMYFSDLKDRFVFERINMDYVKHIGLIK